MATNKLLLDIRYSECDRRRGAGDLSSQSFGKIYRLPTSIRMIGARIARQLRQYGFFTGSFDHFYICFTPALAAAEKTWYPSRAFPRIRDVDYGLSPESINPLTDREKEQAAANATFDALDLVCQQFPSNRPLIERVRQDLALHGEDLEIVHKVKETAKYSITVSYRIWPLGPGVGLVTYVDKTSGQTYRKEFVELQNYQDIYPLVDAISVNGSVIRLTPRSSFQATITTSRYKTPIFIPLATLDAVPKKYP